MNGVVIDDKGFILDKGGTNQVVQRISQTRYLLLGEIGGSINANQVYNNLLKKNMKIASRLYNPLVFFFSEK